MTGIQGDVCTGIIIGMIGWQGTVKNPLFPLMMAVSSRLEDPAVVRYRSKKSAVPWMSPGSSRGIVAGFFLGSSLSRVPLSGSRPVAQQCGDASQGNEALSRLEG